MIKISIKLQIIQLNVPVCLVRSYIDDIAHIYVPPLICLIDVAHLVLINSDIADLKIIVRGSSVLFGRFLWGINSSLPLYLLSYLILSYISQKLCDFLKLGLSC